MKRSMSRRMNLQFFASDDGSATQGGLDSLNSLLDSMNADGNATSTTQQTSTEPTEPTVTEEPSEPNADDTKPQQTPQAQQQKPSQAEKMNYAFGQMRTENAQLKGMLGKIAQAYGIEYKDEQDLIAKLNNNAIENIAKQQNVPVELLQRMEMLERNNQLFEQEQRKQHVLVGLQTVQDKYELTEEQLTGFVTELSASGRNPLLVDVNLEEAYKVMHYDEIMEARVQKAVQAALAKDSVANTHSTTPSNKSGRSSDNINTKINSVSALDDLLRDAKI